jgi:L-ascorbate 6-phosphate lactonase
MIQPILSGSALIKEIENTQPDPGQVAIWWLGQSGFAIKTALILFYVDLYLSEHLTTKYAATNKPHIRMTEAPFRGSDLRHVQWVFASHKHSDHLDPGTLPQLFAASPNAKLILPLALVEYAVSLGLDRERLMPTRGDETLQIGPLTVYSIPCSHPGFDYTEREGYPFLGFVFQVDGLTLYHSGDTILYDGLSERLRPFDLDIAFLPINGTDERRDQLGVPPNMNMHDAVALARQVGACLLIPHHYDMFTFNTADVREFEQVAIQQQQPYAVLRCGQRFCWRC